MINDVQEGMSSTAIAWPSLNALEQRQFAKVVSTFKRYAQHSLLANNRRRKDIYTLPRADQDLINDLGYKQKLDAVDKAIFVNAEFLAKVVEDTQIFDELETHGENEEAPETRSGWVFRLDSWNDETHPFPGPSHNHSHSHSLHGRNHHGGHSNSKPSEFDMDKLRSTLKQLVRDWSDEVLAVFISVRQESDQSLLGHNWAWSLLQTNERCPARSFCRHPSGETVTYSHGLINVWKSDLIYSRHIRVLVPGAGLGRLAYDVAKLGIIW